MRSRKSIVILLSLLLVAALAVSGTFAFLNHKTTTVTNTFDPGRVSCKVNETFNGTTKTDVSITNTGNVRAYIRAEIIVTWQNEKGEVYGVPVKSTDYVMEYPENTAWFEKEDGYYYYPSIVNPGENTADLIKSCKLAEGVTAPAGYYLCVEILASAIQADGVTVKENVEIPAVTDAWGVTVTDGVISK